MAVDFTTPAVTQTEANYALAIRDIASALAVMLDGVTTSNLPTGAIRWSSTNNRLEKFNGTTWAALCSLFDMNVMRLNGYQSTDFALVGHNHSATYQPLDAELTALAGLTSAANKLPYFTGSGAAALADLTAFARTILDDVDAAAVRSTLGLVIGTNVQAFDSTLAALAALTTAADKLIYATGSDTFSTCAFPAAARTLLAATTAAMQRSALGLGNAATLTAGTAANNLVQLDASAQLPAVSGALLTGITAPQISGLSSGMPTGAVVAVASSTVPDNFLECNGAAVSRTTYAALFAAIGVVHGYGNNSTTFNLPDYRGRFLRGWDHAIARDPDRASRTAMNTGGATGDNVGSVQTDAFKSHTHASAASKPTTSDGGAASLGGPSNTSLTSTATGGTETRPINANVMYCIKY